MTVRMSGPSHGSGVRPALCQAMDQLLHGARPTSAATATAVARSSSGYGSPVATMRCGSECAVKTTLVFAGMVASLDRRSSATNRTYAGSVAQLSMPLTAMPCGSAAAVARARYCPTENDE